MDMSHSTSKPGPDIHINVPESHNIVRTVQMVPTTGAVTKIVACTTTKRNCPRRTAAKQEESMIVDSTVLYSKRNGCVGLCEEGRDIRQKKGVVADYSGAKEGG